MANILVFGDSVAYGRWDKESGWVNKLRNFVDKKYTRQNWWLKETFTVYNLGVAGETAETLLEHFEVETKPRAREGGKLIIIFQLGTNDSAVKYPGGNARFTPNEFQKNLIKLVSLAKKFTNVIIFLGLTRVDEKRVNPVPWDKELSYKNTSISEFNNIIKSVCNEKNLDYVNLRKTSQAKVDTLLFDGIHPNTEGHKKIFEIVRDFLVEHKII